MSRSSSLSAIAARMRPWQVDVVGGAAILMMGAGCYLFAAKPAMERRASEGAQATELAAMRESLARTRAARQDTDARLVEVRRKMDAQSIRLEPRSHVNRRLDEIASLAAAAGVGVEKLAPGATADGPRHGTMTLHLTGKARYRACENFVSHLHRRFNDTAVTTLRLAAAPASNEPVHVEFELLWFTQPAPDVKVSQP